jgi:hypothetical protein
MKYAFAAFGLWLRSGWPGELTPIWVPDEVHEAIREVIRRVRPPG